MPLVRIQTTARGQKDVFVAAEPIGHLATVCITHGSREVLEGTTDTQEKGCGVAVGAALSGKLVRVITQGIVSGVVCASSIQAGERVAVANSSGYAHASGLVSGHGFITPFNTITPVGTVTRVSGLITAVSGSVTRVSGSILLASGLMTSGALSGHIGVEGLALINPGGLMSGVTGFLGEIPIFTGATPVFSGAIPTFTGTAFNTARVLGKALASGGMGSGIPVLVTLGG